MTSVNLAGQMKVYCRPSHCSRRADRIQLDWENVIHIPHDVMNEILMETIFIFMFYLISYL